MSHITDPEGEVIHCESCGMYPATREVDGEELGGWAAFVCDDPICATAQEVYYEEAAFEKRMAQSQ